MNKSKVLSLLLSGFMMLSLAACGSNANKNTAINTGKSEVKQEEIIKKDKTEDKKEETSNKEEKIKDGGTMIIAARSDSRVVHPLYGNDRTTLTLINNIFSQLYILKGENIDYYLAESVDVSEDYLTYTVKLKDELTWHDGEKITADDLVFTFNTMMDKKQGSHLHESFETPAGNVKIEKVDELTAKFILPEIQVAFIDTIGSIRMFPKHIYDGIENIQTSDVNENPIGSGPYKFESRKAGESITLARFENYFKGKPHLEKIVYRIIADSNSSDIAFQNGEIDCKYIYPEDVDKFKKNNATVLAFDEDRVGYIIFNQNNDFLKSKELRQAVSYALDRNELLKARYISTEYAHPAKTFLAEQALYKTDDVNDYAYNPEKAKELIQESGLKNIKLTLAYIGKDETQPLLIQQYLSEVGIKVELKTMDAGAFYNALFDPANNNEYDLALNGYIYGKEPSSYAGIFKTSSMNNVNNYSNPEVDKLWDLAAKETDASKRKNLYIEIQQKIMDDAPMYPVSYGYAIAAVNPKFKGLEKAEPAPIYMFTDLSEIYMVE